MRRWIAMLMSVCLLVCNVNLSVSARESVSSSGEISSFKSSASMELKVTGEARYDMAYQVLERVNAQRSANGKNPLVADEELMEMAMQRAAECSLYFGHTRPNGEDCFSASSKMYGENIAMGQRNVDEAMNSWMSSEGHRSNILNSGFQCAGFGVFYVNGVYVWTQCFGYAKGTPGVRRPDQTKTFTVNGNSDLVIPQAVQSNVNVKANLSETLRIKVANKGAGNIWSVYIEPSSFNWKSDLPAVAEVSSGGVVTGRRAGTAVITAQNKKSSSGAVSFLVTVTDDSIFADVPMYGTWEYPYVKYVYDNGLMTGKGKTADGKIIFDPDHPITRAEVVQILYSREGKPEVKALNTFVDVSNNVWYTDAVVWASGNGLVSGKGNGRFDPDGRITRQELVVILQRYAGYEGKDISKTTSLDIYKDADRISSWAEQGLRWAVAWGVVAGKGKNLDPLGSATRAEMAAILKSYIEKVR